MVGKLRERLAQVDIRRVQPWASPPAQTRELVEAWGVDNLDVIYDVPKDRLKVIREKVFANRWHDLTKSEWRFLPFCLWIEEPYIADEEGVFSRLETDCKRRKRKIERLIGAYLMNYSPTRSKLKDFGVVIVELIREQEWARGWREKHERFSLFDPRVAHKNLAIAFIESDLSFSDFMSDVFQDWQKKNVSDFFGEVFREVCKRVADLSPGDEDLIVEIMEWGVDEEEKDLRYPSYKKELASAVLRPFHIYTPDNDLQKNITDFMLRHYGDPRLEQAHWATVNGSDRGVMLRWLSRRSLEVFFAVMDRVALERHWQYRKKFWEHYLQFGMEVWVVFGPDCESLARSFGDELHYAHFEGGSFERNHAVLIMKLKNLIITDWSHNGACRIYSSPSQRPPELYKKSYHAERDLRNIRQGEDGYFRHHATENNPYSWQPRFGDYIYERTNIRIKESDYKID